MVFSHTKKDVISLLTGLLGNLIGNALCGFAVSYALPECAVKGAAMWENKMLIANPAVFVRAIFCVPAFILGGCKLSRRYPSQSWPKKGYIP